MTSLDDYPMITLKHEEIRKVCGAYSHEMGEESNCDWTGTFCEEDRCPIYEPPHPCVDCRLGDCGDPECPLPTVNFSRIPTLREFLLSIEEGTEGMCPACRDMTENYTEEHVMPILFPDGRKYKHKEDCDWLSLWILVRDRP